MWLIKRSDRIIKMYDSYKENPKLNDKLFFNAPTVILVTANSEINGGLASCSKISKGIITFS